MFSIRCDRCKTVLEITLANLANLAAIHHLPLTIVNGLKRMLEDACLLGESMGVQIVQLDLSTDEMLVRHVK
jgi:hypothetical protein